MRWAVGKRCGVTVRVLAGALAACCPLLVLPSIVRGGASPSDPGERSHGPVPTTSAELVQEQHEGPGGNRRSMRLRVSKL